MYSWIWNCKRAYSFVFVIQILIYVSARITKNNSTLQLPLGKYVSKMLCNSLDSSPFPHPAGHLDQISSEGGFRVSVGVVTRREWHQTFQVCKRNLIVLLKFCDKHDQPINFDCYRSSWLYTTSVIISELKSSVRLPQLQATAGPLLWIHLYSMPLGKAWLSSNNVLTLTPIIIKTLAKMLRKNYK